MQFLQFQSVKICQCFCLYLIISVIDNTLLEGGLTLTLTQTHPGTSTHYTLFSLAVHPCTYLTGPTQLVNPEQTPMRLPQVCSYTVDISSGLYTEEDTSS